MKGGEDFGGSVGKEGKIRGLRAWRDEELR